MGSGVSRKILVQKHYIDYKNSWKIWASTTGTDPHHFIADLDPYPDHASHFDAEADPDPDPTFVFYAVPDPDPSLQIKA